MVRDRSGFTSLRTFLTLLVIAAVVLALYWAFLAPKVPDPFTPPTAENADFAEVDYVGSFRDTGLVFDTSVASVARDNASWPKALSFVYRSGAYKPLQFTMGCKAGADCPLQAFQDGIRGMRLGETKVLVLPPEEAYGASDPSLVRTRAILEEVVATETMNRSAFQSRYLVTPLDGVVVRDATWGWNATVTVSGEVVTVRHVPDVGRQIRVAQKWDAEVVGIDDSANEGLGTVFVRHRLTARDVQGFVARDAQGDFIIVGLDEVAGTFTVDYNREIVGRELYFEVTLTALRKGNP